MALTLYQKSNDKSLSTTYYPHSLNYPGLFTCVSDKVTLYYDFQYIFKIYNIDGLVLTKYNSPNKDGIGIFKNIMMVLYKGLKLSLIKV